MFLKNAWYIAAEPQELAAGPIARTILNQSVVVYRTASGRIAVLEDRCPHRLVPLSMGKVEGEHLQCLYHGAQFRTDGTCAHVPGQKLVPETVRARSYPVVERHGYCWVWMGDPAQAHDESTMPGGYWVSGANDWFGAYGHFESMKVDYRLLNDNVIDVTHAEFVHPESFGGEELHFFRNAKRGRGYIDRGMSFNVEDRSIHFRLAASNLTKAEGGPIWWLMLAEGRGMQDYDGEVAFTLDVDWWAPCYTSFRLSVRPSHEPQAQPLQICNLHAAVPETERTTNYFYRSVRNFGDRSAIEHIKQISDFIFGQDKPVLEAQQKRVGEQDLFDCKPQSFAGDRLPMDARYILRRLIAAQAVAHD